MPPAENDSHAYFDLTKLRLLAVLIGVVTVAIITQNIDSRNREACIQIQEGHLNIEGKTE